MASQGPLGPASTSTAAYGVTDWTTVGNLSSDNDVFSEWYSTGGTDTSYNLFATNFGFSLPAGTVDGIKVDIYTGASQCVEYGVSLVKASAITGTDKAAGNYIFGNDTRSWGNSVDLWSTTWTVANINSAGFGFALAVQDDGSATCSCLLDYVAITVYYTASATGIPQFVTKMVSFQPIAAQ